MLSLRADDVELIVIASLRMRDEKLPITGAVHPHRVPPRVPVIEVADDADPPGVRRQHYEADAVHAVERHWMRAELVVEPLMRAFAEQIKVVVAQDRQEAVGILELHDIVAELRPQMIARGAVRHRAGKQSGVMDARQRRDAAMLVDRLDLAGFGEEG